MAKLLLPIALLAFISAIFFCLKMIQRKDLSILGQVLSRLFVGNVYLSAYIQGGVMHPDLVIGILLMFVSDVIYHVSYQYFNWNFKSQHSEFVNKMADLSTKLVTTLDHSLIPFFTIDLDGRIEYINNSFCELVGKTSEELSGNIITEVLAINCALVEELRTNQRQECIVQTSSGDRKAIVIGNSTRNGHETITGSIYLL